MQFGVAEVARLPQFRRAEVWRLPLQSPVSIRMGVMFAELMGVAMHSETKCRYCVLFHTEAAKLFGATDDEVEEAVHYAKMSLGWSAYINGMQIDYDEFAKELGQIGDYLSAQR